MACMREYFQVGQLINNRYKTVAPLNHGSFGMVFVAEDSINHALVAVKCLTKKTSADANLGGFSIDEKSEELVCHARLGSHANIVNLLDSFETEAHVFLVLEYCSRGDLYEAIRAGAGPLETEHVRQFMLQLIDAVSHLHSKGMYHRDIKPENIFLTDSSTMKLGDFGLATSEKWTFEMTVGSDRYMSPEQYDSAGAGYSPEGADIWAVGICLLNILFARNPFTTPTEADPLFLDFSRDKQSLFDVFPTMSQDAYEVIAQCMSLDPRQRSLAGARFALERAISFTTFDDPLDDFCSTEAKIAPHAKREPLRTPSVHVPVPSSSSFPWAKALHASPQVPVRQLSAIIDDESCRSENLFEAGDSLKDWFSAGQQTPSMSSMMDSTLAVSMKSSIAMRRAKKTPSRAYLTPISGSLPVTMTQPKPIQTMATVFGGSDAISKSWSDLWEEDFEEEEATKATATRQSHNARTYSRESLEDASGTPLETHMSSEKTTVDAEIVQIGDIDGDVVADGFFFHDAPVGQVSPQSPHYSPSPRRNSHDKWTALGERRRAYTFGSDTATGGKSMSRSYKENGNEKPGVGFAGFGGRLGICDSNMMNINQNKVHTSLKDSKSRNTAIASVCPWNTKGSKVRESFTSRQYRRAENRGGLEWCGGLHSLHL